MIRKLKDGKYRLYSRKLNPKTGRRRNLGRSYQRIERLAARAPRRCQAGTLWSPLSGSNASDA